jgi:hypothetical protein
MAAPKLYSFDDINQPRATPRYAIDKLIHERSVNLIYGFPGSYKSLLVLDMCLALATGKNFLPSMPGNTVVNMGVKTMQLPAYFIDFDNGIDVSFERESAIGKSYQADNGTPFFHISMPDWKGADPKSVNEMIDTLKSYPIQPRVIVLDTLLRFAGVRDENSSEMDTVMKAVRKISEQLQAIVFLISHSNKNNYGRAANALRGHSSIEGGVDSLFVVKREPNSDIVTVEQQKARRNAVDSFSARFTYKHKQGGNGDLEEARFYWMPLKTNANISKAGVKQASIEKKILAVLDKSGPISKNEVGIQVGGNKAYCMQVLDTLIDDMSVNAIPSGKSIQCEITALGRSLLCAVP